MPATTTLVNFHLHPVEYAVYRRLAKSQTPPKTFSAFVRDALAAKAQPLRLRESLRTWLAAGIAESILRLRADTGGHMPAERLGLIEAPTDTIDGYADVDLWQTVGARLYVPSDGKESSRCYHHLIHQRESDTRDGVIQAYADRLAAVVVETYPEETHADVVRDLIGPHHYYAIGYVGLRKWRSFPSLHELSVRWQATWTNLEDVLPRDDDEQRFSEWAKAWLADRWANRPAPNVHGVIVLHPRQDGGMMTWGTPDGESFLPFYPEPFKTASDNFDAWARAMMRAFRSMGESGEMLRFERYHDHVIAGGVNVVPLTVRT